MSTTDLKFHGNALLLRGAALWLLAALALAWCLVGLDFNVAFVKAMFPGKILRVLQAHLDFLLMSALIVGISATRVLLATPVRWAMVVGAFTNSSLFLLMAIFPTLDSATPPEGPWSLAYLIYTFASILTTSYGFGRAAVTVLVSTFR